MPFDIAGARQAGYTDGEIAGFLADEQGFDLAGATRAGYAPADVIGFLSERLTTPKPKSEPAPLGDPMGSGAAEIMAVSAPKKRSVLEGVDLSPAQFDRAEAERLSRRDYAERTPTVDDPRMTAPQARTARPMTPIVDQDRTLGGYAQDVAAAALNLPIAAESGLADVASVVTAGTVGPGAKKQLHAAQQWIGKNISSPQLRQERLDLSKLMRDDSASAVDVATFMLSNPVLLGSEGSSAVASMMVPLNVLKVAKVLGVVLTAKRAEAISLAVNDLMNAGQAFNDTDADLAGKYVAAGIAGAGSRGVGKLTGGGAEGALARGVAGQKVEGMGGKLATALVKEPGQEYVENFSQQVGQDVGEAKTPDLAAAHKQGVLGAVVAPFGAGMVAHGAGSAQPAAAPTASDLVTQRWGEAFTKPAAPNPIAPIMQAPTVDAAISAAQAAVASPSGSAQAVDNIARILGQESADVGQAAALPGVPEPATGGGSVDAAPGVAVGVGAPAAGVAAVEPGSGKPGPAAGPVSLEAGGPAAVAPASFAVQAAPQMTVNPSGTVAISGDPAAIGQLLRAYGVKQILQGKDGVLVGKSDAQTAQRAMAPFVSAQPVEQASTQEAAQNIPGIIPATPAAASQLPVAQPVESLGATGKTGPGGKNARSRAFDANPFKAFLAKHGLASELADEFAPGPKERRGAMVQGYGPIFRKSGKALDTLAQTAVEEGFLPTPDADRLYQLVARAMRGERIIPQYTAEAAEQEMTARAERERQFSEEEAVAALEVLEDNELSQVEAVALDAPSNVSMEEAMRLLGFTEQEISDAIAEGTSQPQARGEGGRGAVEAATGAPGGSNAGREGKAVAGDRRAAGTAQGLSDDGARTQGGSPRARSEGPGGQSPRQPGSAADDGGDTSADPGRGAGAPDRAGEVGQQDDGGRGTVDAPALSSPTPEDVVAQQERRQRGERAETQRRNDEEQRAAADAGRDEFTLTGSDRTADANPAQADLTAEPAAAPEAKKPATERENQRPLIELRKRKSVLESLLKCLG